MSCWLKAGSVLNGALLAEGLVDDGWFIWRPVF